MPFRKSDFLAFRKTPHSIAVLLYGNGYRMKTDPRYGEKIKELKAHFRSGGTIRTLDQICDMFGYSTRAGAKGFLQKLVSAGLLEFENRSYSPTALMTGFPLFESVRAGLPFTPQE